MFFIWVYENYIPILEKKYQNEKPQKGVKRYLFSVDTTSHTGKIDKIGKRKRKEENNHLSIKF